MIFKRLGQAAFFLALAGAAAAAGLQEQIDELKQELNKVKMTYERTEPVDAVKQVTEWVSPSGEIFREPQKDGISPTDGSKLKERVTYRMMKFSRREAVGDKIDAAVSSAIDGHVIVGLELVGTYSNIVGAGDIVDATGVTRSANRGMGAGSLDVTFSGKPMRNTLIFVDLDAASGTPALSEAWVAVHGPKKVLGLQAGVIDLTGAFDSNAIANDETAQFISGDFVNNPLLGNPGNGLGAVFRLNLTRYQAAFGVQNSMGSAVDFSDNLYMVGELGMLYHLFGDSHWRLWARQQPRGSQQLDQALGLSVDHRLNTLFTFFGRYAKNSYVEAFDEATDTRIALNSLDWAASGGLEITNFNPHNLKERFGLAYGRTTRQDGGSDDSFEAYGRYPLTANFAVSLHYQAKFSKVQASTIDPSTGAMAGVDALPAEHLVSLRIQTAY